MSKKTDIVKRGIPRLGWGHIEYDAIKFEKIKKKRQKKLYVTYIFTMGTIFILCGCLIFTSLFTMKGSIGSQLSDIITGISFPDLTLSWLKDSVPVIDAVDIIEGILMPDTDRTVGTTDASDKTDPSITDKVDKDSLYDFDYSAVPEGETAIIPMDLSLASYGAGYIHNSTGLTPDTEKLLSAELGYSQLEYISTSTSPTVLIIHTHGTEAYSENGAISYKDEGGELARSEDVEKNVIAVGKALGNALREKGIYSVQCEIMHDANGYRDAYTKAEDTVKLYLERYPTIRLVIDLHRDSVIKSSGEIVRPVTVVNDKATAQMMCVVGSNWGGEANDRWEANLALALQFREYLNDKYENVCRPVYLKSSTYNQEFAPYSMLLEIGACGNSLEEACSAAEIAAEGICAVLSKK